ncbi:helix-turn-helix transcriptional regulator [Nocardia heshunensis]
MTLPDGYSCPLPAHPAGTGDLLEADAYRGRDPELAALTRLLDGARVGRGAALVLHGPPGIGKTALLRETARRAPDFQVLACQGVAAESAVPYSALHELIWPLADRIPGLPGTAADALRGLLRLGPPSGDRLAVCTAALLLFTRVATEQPLLLLIDDADHLDPGSAACLAGIARRAGEAGLVLLFGTRADPRQCGLDALPQRRLLGLGEHEARELVVAHHPDLTPADRQRLLRLAEGNPLALTEPLTADALATVAPFTDAEWCADPYPFGPRVRAAYADVLEGLSEQARMVALLVAAAGNGEVTAVRAAATASGVTEARWFEALESGPLQVCDGRIILRNHMIRAVAYHSAPPAQRRAAHRALAESLAPHQPLVPGEPLVPGDLLAPAEPLAPGDLLVPTGPGALVELPAPAESVMPTGRLAPMKPVAPAESVGELVAGDEVARRRRWVSAQRQLAAAAAGPDEGLAAELTTAAADLGRDDERLAGADLLYRAALLSPDSRAAAVRLARSARAAFVGGDIDAARALLERAERGGGRELAARESDGLAGVLALGSGDLEGAHREVDRDRAVVDVAAQAELCFTADRAAWINGRKWNLGTAFRDGTVEPWRLPPGVLAVASGRAVAALDCYRAAGRTARERGESSWQALMLAQSARVRLSLGQWGDAAADAGAALDLAEPNGLTNSAVQSLNTLALHAAFTGDRETAERLCERSLELSRPLRLAVLSGPAWMALGAAALAMGDPEVALARLTPLVDPEHEAHHPTLAALGALDGIEAAVRLGRPAPAAEFLTVLRDWAADSDAAWAVAAVACGRALVDGDATAERHFSAALTASESSGLPFRHARIQLLYGEWLRRTRRRSVAREQLEAAATTFERLGARPWAQRARQESDLVDARSCLRVGDDRDELLTPQEARVARLAATGDTNREIAARLAISHRTVGHHLSRVFDKLGVRCREDLARSPHLHEAADIR